MPLYAQVKNGKIYQVAEGYKNPPFKDAVDITEEIAKSPNDWVYNEGTKKFVYTPAAPTVEDINKEVVKKIRAKYGINDEYEMLRRGIGGRGSRGFYRESVLVLKTRGCRP